MNEINITNEVTTHNSDFVVGDMVVSVCEGVIPNILEVVEEEHGSYDEFIKCKPLGCKTGFVCFLAINEIRHASVAELSAQRRITNSEQALAEVS